VDVSVIIVTHNSRSVIEPCLDSLKKQSMFDQTEVVVVDNASRDGTPQLVQDRYPWVDLYAGARNAGFSVGVNLGIQNARGRYLLILNPDTVVREHSIKTLYQFMEKTPDAGIVAPKLVFHDGNLQYSCRKFYNWRVLILRRTPLGKIFKNSSVVAEHLMLDFDHETTARVDWVLGACMFVRREAVESVGLMDERFFLYFEDVDWCYRMKQKRWAVYYHPEAEVVHDHARESAKSVLNRSFVAHLASLFRYYEKWNAVFYVLKKYREVLKVALFLGADLVAFNLAFLSAYYSRSALTDLFAKPLFSLQTYEQFMIYQNILFVFTFLVLGLYRIRRDTSGLDELFAVGKAIMLSSVLLMASTFLSQIYSYSRMLVAFLAPFAILYDWLLRSLLRHFHRALLAQKLDLKRVCIVGPFSEARGLEQILNEDAARGIDVVGIVATDSDHASDQGRSLGDVSQISEIVNRFRVQELILLPRAVPEHRVAELIAMGRKRVLDVTVLTDFSGLVVHQAEVTDLAGRPAIAYRRDTRYAIDKLGKRLLDIGIGLVFLIVSLPFSVVYFAYASIRGRTPFSRESRLGLCGEPFMLPVAGARSSNGPSDIVNLPLFWLVVTGKLSIVGPYPLPSSHADMLNSTAGFRFDVRPGVTGLWRAGRDGEISLEDLLAQDAGYTRNWSLSRDVKILVVTFGNILKGRKRSLRLKQPTLG
jgi:GT2 family glycosyltransferase/lipopolysaccharide/colanic/teichoic acid biosynthesis glycosyltransferase